MLYEVITAYTNHTILAEALEKWPLDIFQGLLPRVYQIVEEINRRFVAQLREKFPEDWQRQNRMSIISEGKIHMAWLAIHAAFSVNGVAALHTDILKNSELRDWYDLYPGKFNNKTNGVTQRRWLASANRDLSAFITKKIGHGWEKDLSLLKKLEKFADDEATLDEFMAIKAANKVELARYLKETQNVFIDPDSIFDVQIKRLVITSYSIHYTKLYDYGLRGSDLLAEREGSRAEFPFNVFPFHEGSKALEHRGLVVAYDLGGSSVSDGFVMHVLRPFEVRVRVTIQKRMPRSV